MKKFYQIDEFFPAAGDERFSLSAESPLDEVTYNIFTADDFADAALYEYGERKCLFPETETPLAVFHARFARWKAQRGVDIAAAFSAIRKKYDPLQNYSARETKTGTETGLKTPNQWKETTEHKVSQDYKETESQKPNQWKESLEHKVSNDYKLTDEQKPTNWKETTEHKVSQDYKETESEKPTSWKKETQTEGTPEVNNNSATVNDIIPFNGTDFAHVNKSVSVESRKVSETQTGTFDHEKTQTGTRTEEVSQSGTFATEHTQIGSATDEKTTSGTFDIEKTQTGSRSEEVSQTGTFEDKMTYNTLLTREGNIGVTTSQQMAESELELRSKQFVHDVIREFFDIVSVYI